MPEIIGRKEKIEVKKVNSNVVGIFRIVDK